MLTKRVIVFGELSVMPDGITDVVDETSKRCDASSNGAVFESSTKLIVPFGDKDLLVSCVLGVHVNLLDVMRGLPASLSRERGC